MKKIDEAFANAEVLEKSNSTIPPMPIRPSMPSFCSKPDTTLYIFAGCTVQVIITTLIYKYTHIFLAELQGLHRRKVRSRPFNEGEEAT